MFVNKSFFDGPNGSAHVLDLAALNAKRAKLGRARKVTVYVPEYMYLAMKWANAQMMDLQFIEVKRGSSYVWPNLIARPF